MTNYQFSKSKLRSYAEWVSVHLRGDLPAIRQAINDYTDAICKEENLSEYQQNLLHNFAGKLHPKNN